MSANGTHFTGPVFSTKGIKGRAATTGAGAGITGGTGTVTATEITKVGKVINTQIFIDVTGLQSSTTDLDIIGQSTTPAYLAAILNSEMGQIYAVTMTCLEAPLTGVTDIDLYSATAGTGAFDDGIAALVETALVTSGAAWTLNKTATATGWPGDTEFLYLTCGAAGTVGTYTAGKFVIELWGYEA